MKSLFKEHDILLFTETWSNDIYKYDATNFQHFIENRKGKGPKEIVEGLLSVYMTDGKTCKFIKSSCDSTMWLKFDKCLFDVDSDLLLCIVYNVLKGSSGENLQNCLFFFKI